MPQIGAGVPQAVDPPDSRIEQHSDHLQLPVDIRVVSDVEDEPSGSTRIRHELDPPIRRGGLKRHRPGSRADTDASIHDITRRAL